MSPTQILGKQCIIVYKASGICRFGDPCLGSWPPSPVILKGDREGTSLSGPIGGSVVSLHQQGRSEDRPHLETRLPVESRKVLGGQVEHSVDRGVTGFILEVGV